MANYRKSFNFRSGVQVDDDNFIVNANGLVGIGTSVPTELFDLRGNAKIVGLVTASTLGVTGVSNFYNEVKVGSGITLKASTGEVYATTFRGSAAGLTGFYAVATDGWYIDTANSGIFTSFKVGIGTTAPQYALQIGTNPLLGNAGIIFDSVTGNIVSSGGIAATSFTGSFNSSNLTGTIDNARFPTNISIGGSVTASLGFYGNLTGTATIANSIVSTANVVVNSINSGFSTTGIATVHTTLHVPGNIGVGTLSPNSQVHIRKNGTSSIQLTSDGSNSSEITFGRSVTITSTSNNAQFRFGNTNGLYTESTEQSLDIINYDTGNINFYLNPGGSGTGSYNWFKSGLGKMMTLTSSGNLGINSSSPSSTLSVEGNVYFSGVTTVGQDLNVVGNTTLNTLGLDTLTVNNDITSTNINANGKIGVQNPSPVYDIQVGGNPTLSDGVGISSLGNIICSGAIKCRIITAANGFTSGIGVTTPVKIEVSGNVLTFTVIGVGATSLTLY